MMYPDEVMNALVRSGLLTSWQKTHEEDTPGHPYQRLEMVFPDGTQLVVIPEGKHHDGTERLGLYAPLYRGARI